MTPVKMIASGLRAGLSLAECLTRYPAEIMDIMSYQAILSGSVEEKYVMSYDDAMKLE